jgi:hypothetical protein
MFRADESSLIIKYQVIEGECFPMQIKPEGVSITNYKINWNRDTSSITSVQNQSMHFAPVKFQGEEID